ncbi:MAG: hypothetical protein AAF465_09610 [Pseudomonadota bacterium]
MESAFWHSRWASDEIGLHQEDVSPLLYRYWDSLRVSPRGLVFVPLCGKSTDMLWLAKHDFHIVGVELDKSSAERFFIENKLESHVDQRHSMRRYRASTLPITIYQGDFFNLPKSVIHECDVVLDRGSLVALPDVTRRAYSEKLKTDLSSNAEMLLISIEHCLADGPPYSLNHTDINALFGAQYRVGKLGEGRETVNGEGVQTVAYHLLPWALSIQSKRERQC